MVKIAVIGIGGQSVFMEVDHFHQKGETINANSIFVGFGGKGYNQAVAAKRMGANVSFLCAVGNDSNGMLCESYLQNEGIKPFLIKKDNASTAIAFILTDKNGENEVTVFKGAELTATDVLLFENEISTCDMLLLQNEVPDDVNKKAIELAIKYDKRVILNPAPARAIDCEIAKNIYLVTPNEQEVEMIDVNRFQNYIITLGNRGCLINGTEQVQAVKVKAVDTTGAGDTFSGVLAVKLSQTDNISEAAKFANAASGLSVTKKYVINSIPYLNEIERYLGICQDNN